MIRKLVAISLMLGLAMLYSQPAFAGGPFRDVLFNAFCSSLPYQEKQGCHGYLQYRIQRGKSRDEALEKCIWGCGEVMNTPAKIQDCRNGCREANQKDR